MATCITSASGSMDEGRIAMNFDNGHRSLENKFFTYVDDPRISSVKSGRAGQTGLVSGVVWCGWFSCCYMALFGWKWWGTEALHITAFHHVSTCHIEKPNRYDMFRKILSQLTNLWLFAHPSVNHFGWSVKSKLFHPSIISKIKLTSHSFIQLNNLYIYIVSVA